MPGVLSEHNLPHSRGAAFAIHLLLSLLIFSSLVTVMLVYWFPGDLFIMDGGWEGLKLVALVDIVLGPALTLVLFKPGKPGLKFDLSVIAAFQIAALAYGFYTTYNQRTVAVVFAENQFTTLSAKDNKQADIDLAKLDIESKSIPRARAFQIPIFLTPAHENFGLYIQDILNGYPGAHQRSDQYVSVADHHEQLQSARQSIEKLERLGALETIQKALSKRQLTMDDIEVYPFTARYADGFALYDPDQARIIDYVRHAPASENDSVAENDS